MPLSRMGPFLVPALVIAYAGYMIAEQFLGDYRDTSRDYSVILGTGAIVCALIVMVRNLLQGGDKAGDAAPATPVPAWNYMQLISVVAIMAVAVLIIPFAGYLITFFLMLVGALYLLGVRSVPQILAISVVTVLFVHFGLVKELQLPLPAGILEGVL